MNGPVQLADIEAARERIEPYILPLRIAESASLTKRFGCDVLLAHEYLQITGAFKLRGAMNSVLQLAPGAGGVTAVSTGNHGRALAIKAQKPGVCIVGVSMERGCAMYQSQQAGKPVEVEELATLADSLGGGIGLDNELTFGIVRDHVDEMVLLSEAQIADGIRHAYFNEQVILEGGGAVGIAALLAGKVEPGGKTIVLLSGKNIDMELHRKIVNHEEFQI